MPDERVAGRLAALAPEVPSLAVGEDAVTVAREDLTALMRFLKDDPECAFDFLTNLTATDYSDHFTVVYHLVSFVHGHLLTVKCDLPREEPQIPTVMDIWGGADFQEREVFDLLGVVFTGRENSRILLHEGFKGHPLRKDFEWAGGRES